MKDTNKDKESPEYWGAEGEESPAEKEESPVHWGDEESPTKGPHTYPVDFKVEGISLRPWTLDIKLFRLRGPFEAFAILVLVLLALALALLVL